MSRELYFIPIIARAVQDRSVSEALRDAFTEIESYGRQPEFARGYVNFQRFMAEVAYRWRGDRLEALEAEAVRALIAELGTDTFQGDQTERRLALDVISSKPAWQSEYERFCAEVQVPGETRSSSRLLLMRGNVVAGRLVLEAPEQRRSIVSISPGHYALMLESGLLIWERDLSDRELLWSVAFPGKALDLAADTGEAQLQPTVEDTVLGGELILRVFPGLESGRLEIEAR